MAASFAVVPSGVGSVHPEKVPGSFFDVIIELTGDASYPTGGYPFAQAQLTTLFGGAYSAIESVEPQGLARVGAAGATAYGVAYDRVNAKVQLYTSNGAAPAALAEVPNATSVTTAVARLRVRFY